MKAAQLVRCKLWKHKDMNLILRTHVNMMGVMVFTGNPSTREMGVYLGLTTRLSRLLIELQAKDRWTMFLRITLYATGHTCEPAPTHMCMHVCTSRQRGRGGAGRG